MTIGQFGAAADGTVLAVAACAADYCGGLGSFREPTDWKVLISVNDGADWTVAYEERINYLFIEDATVEGLIIGSVSSDGRISSTTHTVVNLAGQERVAVPPTVAGQFPRAVLLNLGQVAWLNHDPQGGVPSKVFRPDGTEITLSLPGAGISDLASLQDGSLVLSLFSGRRLVAAYPPQGGAPRSVTDLAGVVLHGILPDGAFGVGNNYVTGAGPNTIGPVLVDLRALTATPLSRAFLLAQTGRNRFIAYDVE